MLKKEKKNTAQALRGNYFRTHRKVKHQKPSGSGRKLER
jgi:hypothetical protein